MCLLRILDVPPRGIGSSTIMKIRQEAENTQRNVDAILADEIFRKRLTPSVANAVGDFYETLRFIDAISKSLAICCARSKIIYVKSVIWMV